MKVQVQFAFLVASLPLLVSAHAQHAEGDLYRRQGPTTTTTTSPSPAPAPPGTTTVASTGTATTGTNTTTSIKTFPSVQLSLLSTNPTAVPTSLITANATAEPTKALYTIYPIGSTPTAVKGAPPLPSTAIVPASYPPLDKIPPTDSPEVRAWIQEVQNSGVPIPGFSPTVSTSCAENAAAAADNSRCWWSCGGCTRGTDVTTCPDKMTWGLTYDDGPAFYTPNLIEYLNSQNLKATFFVIGSRVISFPTTLQTEYMAGHQIGVHTWSHRPLTTLTNEQIIAELGWCRKAIKDVIGVTPNQMRPPFGDIDDRVRAISLAMGMTPIMWTRLSPLATFDTDDFNINGGVTGVGQVLLNWENILGNVSSLSTGFIVLEHDLFQQAVDVATGYILPDALAHKPPFTIKPVISCLNKPMSDAYVETNDNKTNPPPKSGGPVTLSSGAPGSAQATSKSSASVSASIDFRSLIILAFVGLHGFFWARWLCVRPIEVVM